ncbi:MAG TPA: fatty acyl-AMP ligase, partial [Roseovarius sp.]|nr:fatty acyl-AMP ligase [Roseovarius sp.]
LVKTISSLVRSEYGIDCIIELVPTRTLPRTSSGKLARARARLDFLGRRRAVGADVKPEPLDTAPVDHDRAPIRNIA